jgi:hypothetical protein
MELQMRSTFSVLSSKLFAGLLIAGTAMVGAHAGNVIHVSASNGNDQSGDGSEQKPYLTLSKVAAKEANIVKPGDTVLVHEGVYAPFAIEVSGAPSLPITWKAAPGKKVEVAILPTDKESWQAIKVSASYQVIDGFKVTGPNKYITLTEAKTDYDIEKPNDTTFKGNASSIVAVSMSTIRATSNTVSLLPITSQYAIQ